MIITFASKVIMWYTLRNHAGYEKLTEFLAHFKGLSICSSYHKNHDKNKDCREVCIGGNIVSGGLKSILLSWLLDQVCGHTLSCFWF